jgi:hypothetical protein
MQKEANLMAKKIAFYGKGEAKIHVKQRFWKRRKDGIKQRYWRKTKRIKSQVIDNVRFEFHGKGKDLYKAVVKAHHYIPKGFVHVSAEKFLENPEKYGYEGEWIEKEIES